jgi:hypothetical protein
MFSKSLEVSKQQRFQFVYVNFGLLFGYHPKSNKKVTATDKLLKTLRCGLKI